MMSPKIITTIFYVMSSIWSFPVLKSRKNTEADPRG
jgi:hypothetical protein